MEERALLLGPWDGIPGLFLPTNVFDLCFTVVQELTEELTRQIALLSLITPCEVKAYHKECIETYKNQEIADKENEKMEVAPAIPYKNEITAGSYVPANDDTSHVSFGQA